MQIDPILQCYHRELLENLQKRHDNVCIPNFCSQCSSDIFKKKVLAVLQDPGKSGAERTRECSIFNGDQTSKNQRNIVINKIGFKTKEILFWNFYPYFGYGNKKYKRNKKILEQIACAEDLKNLADRLVNLKVIVICGNEAWLGMKHYNCFCQIPKVWVPHPSNQGIQGRNSLFENGWRKAKKIIER